MKKIIQRFPWFQALIAVLLLGVGIGTIAFASANKIGETMYITWAIALFVVAAAIIAFDLAKFTLDAEFMGLIVAGICIGAGIFVWAKYINVQIFISLLLPYVLISIGGVLLLKTTILAAQRIPFKEWLGMFIVAVIFLTTGIIFLIVKNKLQILYIVLGVLLIVMGAVEFIGFVTVKSHEHHEKKNQVTIRNEHGESKKQSPKRREAIEGRSKKDDIKLLK